MATVLWILLGVASLQQVQGQWGFSIGGLGGGLGGGAGAGAAAGAAAGAGGALGGGGGSGMGGALGSALGGGGGSGMGGGLGSALGGGGGSGMGGGLGSALGGGGGSSGGSSGGGGGGGGSNGNGRGSSGNQWYDDGSGMYGNEYNGGSNGGYGSGSNGGGYNGGGSNQYRPPQNGQGGSSNGQYVVIQQQQPAYYYLANSGQPQRVTTSNMGSMYQNNRNTMNALLGRPSSGTQQILVGNTQTVRPVGTSQQMVVANGGQTMTRPATVVSSQPSQQIVVANGGQTMVRPVTVVSSQPSQQMVVTNGQAQTRPVYVSSAQPSAQQVYVVNGQQNQQPYQQNQQYQQQNQQGQQYQQQNQQGQQYQQQNQQGQQYQQQNDGISYRQVRIETAQPTFTAVDNAQERRTQEINGARGRVVHATSQIKDDYPQLRQDSHDMLHRRIGGERADEHSRKIQQILENSRRKMDAINNDVSDQEKADPHYRRNQIKKIAEENLEEVDRELRAAGIENVIYRDAVLNKYRDHLKQYIRDLDSELETHDNNARLAMRNADTISRQNMQDIATSVKREVTANTADIEGYFRQRTQNKDLADSVLRIMNKMNNDIEEVLKQPWSESDYKYERTLDALERGQANLMTFLNSHNVDQNMKNVMMRHFNENYRTVRTGQQHTQQAKQKGESAGFKYREDTN